MTGAGSGIGAAITERLTSQGAAVAALDVDEVAAQRIVARLRKDGGNLEAFACDVGDADSVDRAIRGAVERFGKLDILVNNAGIAHIGTVQSTSEADLDRVYRVNVKGVYLCTKAAIPHLLNNGGGSIVNLASIASLIGLEDRFAYSMSKGAVLTMTRSVAVDYMSKNIRCNCLCPARVHTPFVDGYLKQHYPGREAEMFEKLSKYQPIGRMGRPDEVATLALYLASDDSSFITGQAFPIDGGVLVK